MAFEGLSSRLQEITRKLSGKARITEGDLKEVLREVKLALLEADVNYKIVKEFVKVIEEIISTDIGDGIHFIYESIEPIREDDAYNNFRVHLRIKIEYYRLRKRVFAV